MSAAVPDSVETLVHAIEQRDPALVKQLLDGTLALATRRGHWDRTGLMVAADRGDIECVHALLPASDPLAQDRDGLTALMFAAWKGDVGCVRSLVPSAIRPRGTVKAGPRSCTRPGRNARNASGS